MSERTADTRRVGLQMVGVGPSGAGFLLAAERTGRFGAISKDGLLVVDRSHDVAVGYLRNFPDVPPNSDWEDFTSKSPESVRLAVARSPLAAHVGQGVEELKLGKAVELQEVKAGVVKDLLGDRLTIGTGISRLVELGSGRNKTYLSVAEDGRTIESDVAVISTGGRERLDPNLSTDNYRDRTFLAEDLLGIKDKDKTDNVRALVARARRVAVIGAGHASPLVIEQVLASSDAQVDLLHRGEIVVHSKSRDQAEKDNLTVTEEALADDPEGKQPWRFKGSRGRSRGILVPIILNQEPRVTKHRGDFRHLTSVLDKADVVLQCKGLDWNEVSFYREGRARPAGFWMREGKVVVNNAGNPYAVGEGGSYQPVEQVFIVGMASVGVDSGVINYQAVNFYEGIMGDRRVDAVVDRLQQVAATRGSERFSLA